MPYFCGFDKRWLMFFRGARLVILKHIYINMLCVFDDVLLLRYESKRTQKVSGAFHVF